jgi:hypothetical protein
MIENGRWPPLGADSVSCSPDDHEVVVAQLGVRPDVAGQRAGRIDAHALVGREAVLADGAGAHLHDPVHAARHATLPDELAVAGFGEPAVFRFDPDLIEALIVLGEREGQARGPTSSRPPAAVLEVHGGLRWRPAAAGCSPPPTETWTRRPATSAARSARTSACPSRSSAAVRSCIAGSSYDA